MLYVVECLLGQSTVRDADRRQPAIRIVFGPAEEITLPKRRGRTKLLCCMLSSAFWDRARCGMLIVGSLLFESSSDPPKRSHYRNAEDGPNCYVVCCRVPFGTEHGAGC